MNAFLDIVLNFVTVVVFVAVAIPVFVICVELVYAPFYVSLPVAAVIAIAGTLAWRWRGRLTSKWRW